MLIEFVKNPQFQPPAPPIRVGSVLECSATRYVVVDYNHGARADCRARPRNSITSLCIHPESCASSAKLLPLRVSGITEDGEWEYAPIDPPPQEFSWSDYPPRAGMVVEWVCEHVEGRLRLLIERSPCWRVVANGLTTACDSMNDTQLKANYRPRPDLMPRFVEQKR